MTGPLMRWRWLLGTAALSLAACAGMPRQAPEYEASITRTRFGIPHVKAADYGGLGFGAAYARAQDNICLMADSYVGFAGQRSKFFGADGPAMVGLVPTTNVESDVFHQSVPDLPRLRTSFEQRSADYRALVDGWIAGYNRYLSDYRDRLPSGCAGQPWVREITRDDVLLSLNAFAILSSSGVLATHLTRAAPPGMAIAAITEMPLAADVLLPGSNGWAFGGDATSNQKGLVLANPHFPWAGSNRFYETHLTIPGEVDVAGAAIMNLPYVGVGFNRDVAWTHTVDMAMHMTLYKLALDPDDPAVYRVDGQREAMTRRELRIENKDGTSISRTLYSTRYGPVVSVPGSDYEWTRQVAYAVADANNGNIRSGDTWLDMARARNVDDIRRALGTHRGAPFLNTLAADRAGDALYADISTVPNVSADLLAACGGIKTRPPGHLQELMVLDGSRSACTWETSGDAVEPGLLPASRMAALQRRDYVQNSNDSYRWANPAALQQLEPVMGRDPGIGRLRTRSGIEEIRKVLSTRKFDAALAAETMFGNKVLAAELALDPLLALCKRPEAPADACAALARWDGKAELDSRGAMLFGVFWSKLGDRADIWTRPFDPNDMTGTPRGLLTEGTAADVLLAALNGAADEMRKRGLALDAPLGEVQFATRGDERIPISGLQSGGTLNYTKAVPSSGGYEVIFGASYVQAVGFDESGPVANAVLAYSQSTDPASPHYADQTREFSKKKLHRYPFSESDIAAHAIGAPLTIRQPRQAPTAATPARKP